MLGEASVRGLRREVTFRDEYQVRCTYYDRLYSLRPGSLDQPFKTCVQSHASSPSSPSSPCVAVQVAFSLSELEAAGGEIKEKWFTLKPADKEPGGLPCLGDTGWLRSGFSLPQLLAREGSGGTDGPRLRLRLRLGREVLRPAEMYSSLLREACAAPACVTAVFEACPQAQHDTNTNSNPKTLTLTLTLTLALTRARGLSAGAARQHCRGSTARDRRAGVAACAADEARRARGLLGGRRPHPPLPRQLGRYQAARILLYPRGGRLPPRHAWPARRARRPWLPCVRGPPVLLYPHALEAATPRIQAMTTYSIPYY